MINISFSHDYLTSNRSGSDPNSLLLLIFSVIDPPLSLTIPPLCCNENRLLAESIDWTNLDLLPFFPPITDRLSLADIDPRERGGVESFLSEVGLEGVEKPVSTDRRRRNAVIDIVVYSNGKRRPAQELTRDERMGNVDRVHARRSEGDWIEDRRG